VNPPVGPRLSWFTFAAILIPFLIVFGLLLQLVFDR